jgi:glycosyltransferase involved in cell wall biosynthesis
MARIVIATTGHPSTSPRVVREADALAAAGHEVQVTGVWLDAERASWDEALVAGRAWTFVPAADLRGGTPASRVARLGARVRTRVGRARLSLGQSDSGGLGYAVGAIERTVRDTAADLVVLHLEPALAIAERLLADGARVMLDIEDWYSEISATDGNAAPVRAEVARLERAVFPRVHAATTTSRALARALAAHTGMREARVVYNGVGAVDAPRAVMPAAGALRIVWFSQHVSPGRGLELAARALAELPAPWTLTVIGQADAARKSWLLGLFPGMQASRVTHVPAVPPARLGALLATHHVGLALEPGSSRNNDLTVSNKLCHYLQCGLATIATDTGGQAEVMAQMPGAGAVIPRNNALALATTLERWMRDPQALADAVEARRTRAAAVVGAEAQAGTIVAAAAEALAGGGA